MIYPITPTPKPRMTQSDKWKTRPSVMRYRAFKDKCAAMRLTIPEQGAFITFWMPMPKSWTKKKKAEMEGQPHKERPDIDNLLKALLETQPGDDSRFWHFDGIQKRWARKGMIEIL